MKQETNDSFNELIQAVEAAGGWDGYYQISYKEQLKRRQQRVKEFDHTSSADSADRHIYAEDLSEIEQIQTLFSLHEALSEYGYRQDNLFLKLAHTLDYYGSVLLPMKKLVEQGKTQEAIDLFSQPRHYHR
ncbi:MAG: hypothetical protein NTZ93_00490 [Candidatus Beckwithbacteria bacterium]|nr:hypothetical protein [Candidatus Beckwithbacteria bacterium]